MRYKIENVKDLKAKIKACEELSLDYELRGKLKEVEYDIVDNTLSSYEEDMGKMIGDISNLIQDIDSLIKHDGFNDKNLKFEKIILNNDRLGLEKGDKIELECIKFKHKNYSKIRYYILHDVYLIVKSIRDDV